MPHIIQLKKKKSQLVTEYLYVYCENVSLPSHLLIGLIKLNGQYQGRKDRWDSREERKRRRNLGVLIKQEMPEDAKRKQEVQDGREVKPHDRM